MRINLACQISDFELTPENEEQLDMFKKRNAFWEEFFKELTPICVTLEEKHHRLSDNTSWFT